MAKTVTIKRPTKTITIKVPTPNNRPVNSRYANEKLAVKPVKKSIINKMTKTPVNKKIAFKSVKKIKI